MSYNKCDILELYTPVDSFNSLSSNENDSSRLVFRVDDPFVNRTFKTYVTFESLGQGAFGQVYLVSDQQNDIK